MADAKRVRKLNWSKSEICSLIEAVALNQALLLSKFRSTDSNRKKQEAWKDVVRTICAQSSAERSMDEVKKIWKDLVSQAKKDNHSTGGGPQPQNAEWTDAILNVFGLHNPIFIGIEQGEEVKIPLTVLRWR